MIPDVAVMQEILLIVALFVGVGGALVIPAAVDIRARDDNGVRTRGRNQR